MIEKSRYQNANCDRIGFVSGRGLLGGQPFGNDSLIRFIGLGCPPIATIEFRPIDSDVGKIAALAFLLA